jgi:hypothetical protein
MGKNDVTHLGKKQIKIDVQASLWDGDPDIDAVQRITISPTVRFDPIAPYGSPRFTVFNSQNTFLSRDVLPYYMVIPHVGRMDDIWGCYFLQKLRPVNIVFTSASVYQQRNIHNLFNDLRKEVIGYENNLKLIESADPLNEPFVPPEARAAFEEYRKAYQ